ncbi:MAG: outer membrane lipoprotein-sorting protein [Bdellovibrionales bacterium]
MKFVSMLWLVTFASLSFSFAESPEEKGLRIAKEVEKANEGWRGDVSTIKMVLINAYGEKTDRRMKTITKERKSDGDLSINEFLWPADVKGTKLLTHAFKEKSDDQWLFLPALKRVKRISSRNKSGSFMGSEFSYEDLGSQEPEKFSHKFIKDSKVKGRDVYHTERVPTDKYSAYSKQEMWIDKQYNGPLKINYFDKKGELLKTAIFSSYKKYGRLWRVGRIHAKNVQTKKESTLTWSKRKLGAKIARSRFDSTKLKSGGDGF